jgi:hypothetical protein
MFQHSGFRYGTDDEFRTVIGPFLAEGIERSEAMLAVTTAANIEMLRDDLGKDAGGIEFVDASTWYSSPVAALQAYKSFSDARLSSGAHWVRVVGEPVWAGRTDAEVRLWTRYESLLNLVFNGSPMSVVCPYDERSVAPEIVMHAHLTHPHMVGDGGTSQSPDYTDPGRFALEP